MDQAWGIMKCWQGRGREICFAERFVLQRVCFTKFNWGKYLTQHCKILKWEHVIRKMIL